MEWFALILPVICIIILKVFFYKKVQFWEYFILPIVISILILIIKTISVKYNVTDTEFWNYPVSYVEYYEDWNEYIEQTCSTTCCCDSDGNNCQTTYYDCSYVRYHDEYYQMVDEGNFVTRISKSKYNKLKSKFNNNKFVDLNRDYHTIDGDKYVSTWDKSNSKLELSVTSHYYENKVAATHSVFNYKTITQSEIDSFNLFNYPPIIEGHQSRILSQIEYDKNLDHLVDILNARLGPSNQLTTFFLIFKDKDIEVAKLQQHLWKNGNKNEMVINVGVDNNNNITWVYLFSWTERHDEEIVIRNWAEERKGKKLDLKELINYSYNQLKTFKRKEFSDFDYLNVELTLFQLILVYIISLLSTISLSLWIVLNPYDNKEDRYSKDRILRMRF